MAIVFVLYLVYLFEGLVFLGVVDGLHPFLPAEIDVAEERVDATFVFDVVAV